MKTIKALLLTLSLFFCQLAFAQDELKARLEFEAAESQFTANDFGQALTHLDKTEILLGKWTPKVSYLKIQTLDKLSDLENFDSEYVQKLIKEVKLYMDFAGQQKDDVIMDKFKLVYSIDETLKPRIKNAAESKAADYLAAQRAEQDKNYEKAMADYVKAAEKGNTNAIYNIGRLYENGLGVAKDGVKALGFYQKAADLGNVLAYIKIGDYYSNASAGLTPNDEKAKEWYQKALQVGNVEAIYKLGLLQKKASESKDAEKSFLLAAEKGNPDAMYSFGEMMEEQSLRHLALEWYEKAADKGQDKAIAKAMELYADPSRRNLPKKAAFYLKQANAGNVVAAHLLGLSYYNGEGVNEDHTEARKWLLKSVNANGKGAFYLAMIYHYGVDKDYAKAAEYYIKEDTELSLKSAAELYKEGGYNLQKDSKKAGELMKLSRSKK